ncbi:MAG: hypothetical protein V3T86_18315 [Planctomycetota bacterium]
MVVDHETRIADRVRSCKIERRSYEIWLGSLRPANFLLVGVGGTLSLLAGMSIVTQANLIDANTAGWITVGGALLTGLHNRLRCDPHQAECWKLATQFAELQTDYERLELETQEQPRKEMLMAVEQKLAAVRAGRGAFPSAGARKQAEQEAQA